MNNLLIRLSSFSIQRCLIFGLLLTGFWYGFLFDDGAKLEARIQQLKSDLATEQSKEKESDMALKEIAAVQASIASLSDQFKIVSEQLPTEIQMAEIIRTVDKVSKATGLNVKSKEPKSSQRNELIETLPLVVSAEGSYSEITNFFYYLSTLERVVRVRGFKMNAPSDLKKNRFIQMSGEVVSYKFIPQSHTKIPTGVKK